MKNVENEIIQKQIKNKYDAQRKKLLRESEQEDFVIEAKDTVRAEIESCCDLTFSEDNIEDELIAVHATNYLPQNGIIKTSNEAGVIYGNEEKGKCYAHRDTLHFSLNHLVTGHSLGDWSDKKYIILMPFKDIDNIIEVNPVDTYVQGNLTLPSGSIIMISPQEYEKLTEEEKNTYSYLKFDGDSKLAVQQAMILLGKKPQTANVQCLTNEKNTLYEYKKNSNKDYVGSHFDSYLAEFEYASQKRDQEIYKLRGKLIDTRHKEQDITIEEVSKILENIVEDVGKSRIDEEIKRKFIHNYIFSGLSRDDGGKYKLLSDKEALERFVDLGIEGRYIGDKIIEQFEEIYNLYQQDLKQFETLYQQDLEQKAKQEVLNKYYGEELTKEEQWILSDLLQSFLDEHLIKVSENEVRGYRLKSDGRLEMFTDNEEVYTKFDELSSGNGYRLKDGDEINGTFVTDFLPQKEGERITIRKMIERAGNYITLFEELYKGKNIKFNQYGEKEEIKFSKKDFQAVYEQSEKENLSSIIGNLKQTEEKNITPESLEQ